MKTAILAIILFCVMIFPHELGHFIAAKKMGIKVNEFAFGMGPAIFRRQGSETLYTIRLFPIGGFCAMEGEDEESDEPRAFNNKKPWQKLVVLVAGSFMNVVCYSDNDFSCGNSGIYHDYCGNRGGKQPGCSCRYGGR